MDIKTINFESLQLCELEQLRDEINCLIQLHKLHSERYDYIRRKKQEESERNIQIIRDNYSREYNQISEQLLRQKNEKEELLKKIEQDKILLNAKHEKIKSKLNYEELEASEESEEAVVYNKKNPKGKLINKRVTKKK